MLVAVLQGAVDVLVVPCCKSKKPAVVPLALKLGPVNPPVSVLVTVVALSVMLEAATQAPETPPLISTPAAIVAEVSSFVVELKQGMPPEYTVPETVTGKAEPLALPFEAAVTNPF